MPGPLDGIKVLDFCMYGNGPAATASLAEQGADVVKVEPLSGDRMRNPPGTFGPGFEILNRMKRSIAMDIRTDDARPVLDKLIAWADVVRFLLLLLQIWSLCRFLMM